MSSLYRIQTAKPAPLFSSKAATDSNLVTVALFCTLGLLISPHVMIRYPEFGAIIAQCNQF
jgi:hypothetical protein